MPRSYYYRATMWWSRLQWTCMPSAVLFHQHNESSTSYLLRIECIDSIICMRKSQVLDCFPEIQREDIFQNCTMRFLLSELPSVLHCFLYLRWYEVAFLDPWLKSMTIVDSLTLFFMFGSVQLKHLIAWGVGTGRRTTCRRTIGHPKGKEKDGQPPIFFFEEQSLRICFRNRGRGPGATAEEEGRSCASRREELHIEKRGRPC